MKKFLCLLLALVLAMGILVGCGGDNKAPQADSQNGEKEPPSTTTPASGETIKIGVSTAITGAAPLDGERSRQGIEMAVDEINANGGVLGRELEIIIEDDQNTSSAAVNVANKLVNNSDIVAIIGPHRSANAMAVEQIMAEAKMPFLTGASSPNLVTQVNNPYFFRVRASDRFVGQVMARVALEQFNAEKIGIIYNNDDYGSGGKDVVVEYLKGQGVEPVVVEGHNTDDKDMSSAITKCKDADVDALIVYTHDPEAAILVRQMNEMDLAVPAVSPVTFTLPTFLSLTTVEETKNLYGVADFVTGNPDPMASEFAEKFNEEYGVYPDLFGACYYAAVYVVADAIERAGVAEREAIQKALLETRELKSVYGELTANEDGELVHSAMIAKIVDQTPVYETTIAE